jgi:tetratricopeptide (TPR) repeat protein
MPSRLNLKLLSVTAAAVLLLGVAGFFLHRLQVRRNADDLLAQAQRCEEQGRPDRAVRFLLRYLMIRPHDVDVREHIGAILEPAATSAKAIRQVVEIYRQVLVHDERPKIRRKLAELYLKLGDYDEARRDLELLLQLGPDPQLEQGLGQCLEAKGEYAAAAQQYLAAIEGSPQQIESYVRLAELVHRYPEPVFAVVKRQREKEADMPENAEKLADWIIDRMVAANKERHTAHLERAAYELRQGRRLTEPKKEAVLASALRSIRDAARLAPDDLDVLLTASAIHEALALSKSSRSDPKRYESELAEARGILGRAGRLYPQSLRVYLAQAQLELEQQTEAGSGGDRHLAEAEAVVRRGLNTFPGQPALLEALFETRLRQKDYVQARAAIEELRKQPGIRARADYHEGRLRMEEGQWADARDLLERARSQVLNQRDFLVQIDLLLGRCHRQLGNPDLELASYQRALQADRNNVGALYWRALAQWNAGRLDEALAALQQVMDQPRVLSSGWILLSRLLILRNVLRPATARWDDVKVALDRADAANPGAADLPILRAEAQAGMKQFDAARATLDSAKERYSDKVEIWIALAGLSQKQGNDQEASAWLDQAAKKFGDRPDLELARLSLALNMIYPKPEDYQTQILQLLDRMRAHLDQGSREEQVERLRAMASAYARVGKLPQAQELWQRTAHLLPKDLWVQMILFDVALQLNDEAGMDDVLQYVRSLESGRGPLALYGEASLLVWRYMKTRDKTALAKARADLNEAAIRRPSWARVPMLLGRIDELEGRYEQALTSYLQALQLGERKQDFVKRTVELLSDRQRYAEAEGVLRRLLESAPISKDLQQMAAQIALQASNPAQAVYAAREAVNESSPDYRDHLWQGRVFLAAGKMEEAERAFRKALALEHSAADSWLALIRFQMVAKKRAAAEATLEEATRKLKEPQRSLTRGHAFEILGNGKDARSAYEEALRIEPGNIPVLHDVADYFIRTGPHASALPLLRRLLDPKTSADTEQLAWARRGLALTLVTSGRYGDFPRALALLEENERVHGKTAEDVRARAVLLSTRPDRRREAIAAFGELLQLRPQLPPELTFILVRLYAAEGEWKRAQEQLLKILDRQPRDSAEYLDYLTFLVEQLVQKRQYNESEIWLQQVKPNSERRVILEARTLATQIDDLTEKQKLPPGDLAVKSKRDRIVQLARDYVSKSGGGAAEVGDREVSAASMLAGLGRQFSGLRSDLDPVAEAMFREGVRHSAKPVGHLALAAFLADQKRPAEALETCFSVRGDAEAEETAARLAVSMLSANEELRGSRGEATERWISDLLSSRKDSIPLWGSRSDLLEMREKFDDAESAYRQILSRDPAHVYALNNLAVLITLRGKNLDEALQLIDHCLEQKGAEPELLDTRAMVYLARRQFDLARQDLSQAIRDRPSATAYFHLAQVELEDGRSGDARKAWGQAVASGLSEKNLHPLERPAYRKMQRDFP